MSRSLDWEKTASLSMGLGLNLDLKLLFMDLGLGESSLTAGGLVAYFLGDRLSFLFGFCAVCLVLFSFAVRLLQLIQARGTMEGVYWSDQATKPYVSGWWRARIVMPCELKEVLSPIETEAVLAHEKAHVRRGDHRLFAFFYLLGSLKLVVWPLFIVLHGMEQAIERICDAEAAHEVSRRALGKALFKVAALDLKKTRLGPAFSPERIEERLRSLKPDYYRESRFLRWASFLFLGFTVF